MYLGTQVGARDDTDFKQWSQLGVSNICSDPGGDPHSWTKDVLSKHREKVENFGLTLDMVQLPLSSTPIENSQSPNIMLGKSPERDREIESVQNLIKIISESEIPSAKYNMNIIGIPRSEKERGRGGSLNSTLRFEKIKNESEETKFNEYKKLHKIKDEKKLYSWFRDQVLHPHETQHTFEELIPIFQSAGYNIISTSINNFKKIDNFNEIVDNEKKLFNIAKERLKFKEYFPGFFVTVGEKV